VKYHPAHLPSGLRVREWRILKRLHVGGFGAVYLVDHEGQRYALKISLHRPDSTSGKDPAFTDERTRRELTCLLTLDPPHVPRLICHGRWPDAGHGYLFFVMEYVEGDTLTEWAARHPPALRQVLHVFIGLAAALEAAEARSILHRDIKPSNILVRAKGSAAVLLDWGSSDFPVAKDITEGALAPGTPPYRSPESLRFARLHRDEPGAQYAYQPTDDIYALGVSFYEVLTGRKPFPTPISDRQRLNAEIELRIPPAPHELNPHVPAALSELVCRLLAKDPRDRPAGGLALRRELESLSPESSLWEAPLGLPRPAPGSRPPSEAPPPKSAALSRGGWLAIATVAVAALAYAGAELLGPAPQTLPPPPLTAPSPPEKAVPLVQSPPDAGSPPLPSPLETQQTVKTPEPSKKRRLASREVLKTGCLVAMAGLDGGCATAPIKPPRDECPPEVMDRMVELGFVAVPDDRSVHDVLVNLTWGKGSLVQPGPIVGRVTKAHERRGKIVFPEGTLLHGYFYTWQHDPKGPWSGRANYTEAQFPSGEKAPVCLSSLPPTTCVPQDGAFDCTMRHIVDLYAVSWWGQVDGR